MGEDTFWTASGHAVCSFAFLLAGGADHSAERPSTEESLVCSAREGVGV